MYGKVYLIKHPDPQSGRKFALKRMSKLLVKNHLALVQGLGYEKRVIFDADHKNICPLEYLFETDCNYWSVMPYLEGGNLRRLQLSLQDKRFTESQAKFYLT